MLQVPTEIPILGIKTFFYPEIIRDYWRLRIYRKLAMCMVIINFLFLGLAYLINLDTHWIDFLLVVVICLYLYHLITDLMMQEFNNFHFVFQGLLILGIAFYNFFIK